MNKSEYQGQHQIGRAPDPGRLAAHNAKSWAKVEQVISRAGGSADFDALSIAVKDHESGKSSAPHPYQFIVYCIRNGWLVRQDHKP